ncbi:MAG: class I SAM-dependent methyltransferase [Kofleriaceae bacterium]
MKPQPGPHPRDEQLRQTLAERGLWATRAAFDRYHAALFRGLSFAGRTVLDVGGGIGTCSFLAALGGAREVVCLDPEFEGATRGTGDKFRAIATEFDLAHVRIEPVTLQTYRAPPASVDVVVFHNSINHVEEEACIALRRRDATGDAARQTYRRIFTQVADLMPPGGDLIIADCSSENLFPRLGLRHPISRSIEWHKHQPPEVWARELAQVGFHRPRIQWTAYSRSGALGWKLTANRWAAYVLTGHFVLHMQRR